MFRFFETRLGHYSVLIACTLLTTLPNLGAFSLFDYDEGVNAEAAREMLEADNWVVPMFNFELRTAKPIMLYWLQMTSYEVFGISEFSARFPSLLLSVFTVLLVYELGRSMFRPSTGLIAGLALSSAIYFNLMAHAATPDATLLCFTVLTFFFAWRGSRDDSRWWFVPAGMASGLAVLTKGPVGLALPGFSVLLFLIWNRELHRLWDKRLIWGLVGFGLVALPWYIIVSVETRGTWPAGFFGKENLQRFSTPLENHRGPIYYHLIGLLIFFAPWSVFLGISLWNGVAESRTEPRREREATRFLLCWFGTYLVFFSLAATKLPNYVLPVYPALAILTARFLDMWRRQERAYPRWIMPAAWSGMTFVGAAAVLGLLIVGGAVTLPSVKMQLFPGIEKWAFLGVIPWIATALGIWLQTREQRGGVIASVTTGSLLFVGSLAACTASEFDPYKAPKLLVDDGAMLKPNEEVRIGSLYYFEPSVVFYSQREVKKLETFEEAIDFLSLPYHVFLLVPESTWPELSPRAAVPVRLLATRYDFLKNCTVVLLTNR